MNFPAWLVIGGNLEPVRLLRAPPLPVKRNSCGKFLAIGKSIAHLTQVRFDNPSDTAQAGPFWSTPSISGKSVCRFIIDVWMRYSGERVASLLHLAQGLTIFGS